MASPGDLWPVAGARRLRWRRREDGGEGTATPGGSATPDGATAAASSATPTPSGHTVEITLWHDKVAATLDTIEALARRFNSSQSEVKVKLAFQGTDVEEMTKLVASLGGGELPNIVYRRRGHHPAPHR